MGDDISVPSAEITVESRVLVCLICDVRYDESRHLPEKSNIVEVAQWQSHPPCLDTGQQFPNGIPWTLPIRGAAATYMMQ